MNKQQIQQAAKEFCEANGFNPSSPVDTKTPIRDDVTPLYATLTKFLQSMIEKGNVFDRDSLLKMTEDTYRRGVRDAEGLNPITPLLITSQVTAYRILKSQCRGEFHYPEPPVSSAGKEVKEKLPHEDGWFDVNFKRPTLSIEYECILSDCTLIKLKYNSDFNTFCGNTPYKHGDSVFVVKWRHIKSSPTSTEISQQDVENQINYTFPIESDNTHIRERQIFRNAIDWYREQLKSRL